MCQGWYAYFNPPFLDLADQIVNIWCRLCLFANIYNNWTVKIEETSQ